MTKNAHRWTEDELRKVIGMWLEGRELKEIADALCVTCAAINKITVRLRREGVPFPRRTRGHKAGNANKLWTQEEIEYLVRRRHEKATAEQLAIELDRSFYAVQAMILKIRQEGVDIGMLGHGTRRLWSPERLNMAIAGRGLNKD